MAQTAITVRMDSQQKILFDQLCEQFGMSANAAINVFVKAVIRTKSIPFTIKVKEAKEEMALDMMADNEPVNKILKYSKLALSRIQELASQNGYTLVTE